MFCENCGVEVKKEGNFCENCGAGLINEKKEPKTKKQKIIERVIIGVLIVLGFMYVWFKHQLSPEVMAKDYFLAVVNQDIDKLYNYIDVDESEFITKDILKEVVENKSSEGKMDLKSYTINDVTMSYDGVSASVDIDYVLRKNNKSSSLRVEFVKNEGKKYLFFDDWRIVTDDQSFISIQNDYTIEVPKGSTIAIRGMEVDKKYIDTYRSTSTHDIYEIPAIFGSTYKMKIALPFGFDVDSELVTARRSSYKFEFKEEEIPDNVKTQIKETAKSGLQVLYDGAIAQKSFEEIKSAFDYEGADLESLKQIYEKLQIGVSDSKLNAIQFTDINFHEIKSDKETIKISMKVDYSYTIGEVEKKKFMYIEVDYANIDQSLKIVNMDSLITNFSRD